MKILTVVATLASLISVCGGQIPSSPVSEGQGFIFPNLTTGAVGLWHAKTFGKKAW